MLKHLTLSERMTIEISIMYIKKTLYNYIDSGLITSCNIDLPRKVKCRPRRKVGLIHKVDWKCRIGRT